MGAYVCAHGRTGCAYCRPWAGGPPPATTTPTCPVCSAKREPGDDVCVACAERGFVALPLFDGVAL
jgi:hypothetical protein